MGAEEMESGIAFLSVAELGARYRAGSLSPVDVVAESLRRLQLLEPKLNAVAHVMADEAIADAERLAAELSAGRDRGPLHGIPVAIKDIIDVAGAPTGFASRVRKPIYPAADAPLVERLRAAGAILLCKTNLLEYAYGIAHPDIGQTNNPHDVSRTSGGSSGGSAALVAAGVVPLSVGTDTGGSIRIPASYCGIVGLKPTYGLVPTEGVFPLSWSLDHAGPLARSAGDAALMLACLTGRSDRPASSSLSGLRVGLIGYHCDSHELTPAVAQNMTTVAAALKAHGAIVETVDIPELALANSMLRQIIKPEASLVHADLHLENPDGYAPRTLAQVISGFDVRAVDYIRAQQFQAKLRQLIEARFADVDVLLSPSVPFPAPVEDPEFTEEGEEGEMLSSGFANVTGHPAVSIPSGMDGRLPLGIQLVGRLDSDAKLLEIAAAVEAVLGAYRQPEI